MTTSSRGLKDLLKRKNLTPTGDMVKDLELAKSVMPAPYKKGEAQNSKP